ncbi:MAG: U32 family peptidase [Bacillaceae bacterium]|nr:U32 family peptidase [Bacillaceae bacterium]
MKKPELLATAADFDELKGVIEAGADAVHIGGEKYALRTPGRFSMEEIRTAAAYTREKGAKLYVAVNSLMHNEDLDGLPAYLSELGEAGVDAIVFSDPAVLMTARAEIPEIPLHFSTEITTTNVATINYWASRGASRADLARELNMEEIIETKEQANLEIQVQVHGIMCMFHSKRDLVTNYLTHRGEDRDRDTSLERRLFIREEKREDYKYPIYEDDHGTHIMSAEDVCMIDHLSELLDAGIDSLKVDGLMKSADYQINVVKAYREAIDLYLENPVDYEQQASELRQQLEAMQPDGRPLTTGFFFKEQIF